MADSASISFLTRTHAWTHGHTLGKPVYRGGTGPPKKPERSICLGLVMAARQSRLGSKFLNLKILNFLLLPQNFTTNQGLHSKFSHPTPRAAYQCSYAKEIRWIGPKLTELEPFSWTRSKFAIFDEVKIRHFGRILISAVRAQFWGDRPHFFSCCPIIVYILGSYHALPLNPDFWVDLRAQMIAPPPALNSNKKRPR